ncbi:type IV secretory system conjugative DNA transfer family protein [Mycoplasmopsis cynos]|uniref:type IV secretory system conjugative DNA transfer family protein n=1 Tax=Mycoplasmopsis cynos TaxID=171284 RepID=UPI002AFFF1B1|nr:type IV secretory system conjugative DNA transfer family protein [Mycoplasmopsis cynos]WQQ17484.1 type IV secretory system conjugative DNA transfer family protein [Mycoplasmopsis cynos]
MNKKVLIIFKLVLWFLAVILSFYILFGLMDLLIAKKGVLAKFNFINIINFSFINNFKKIPKYVLIMIFIIYSSLNITLLCYLFKNDIKQYIKNIFHKQSNNNWLLNEITREKDYRLFKKYCSYKLQNSSAWVMKFSKNRKKWLNINHNKLDRNSLIIGGTGSGKTQRILLPNILYNINLKDEYRPNFIINDPKREIINFVGNRLKTNGYKIYVIDFERTKNSLNWNPLTPIFNIVENATINKDIDLFYDAYRRLLELIENLVPLPPSGDEFWTISGRKFIEIVAKTFLLMKFYLNDFDIKNFNFTNIVQNVALNFNNNYEKLPLYKILNEHKNDNENWHSVYKDYLGMVLNAEATLGSQKQSGIRPLDMFINDEFIKNLTSYSNLFNINKIMDSEKNEKFAIFIHYSDQNTANHKLVSLLVDEIYQAAIDKAKNNLYTNGFEKLERRLLIILEEFGNLPKIPNLDNKLSINRSRNILFCLVLQDKNQLKKYNTNINRDIDNIILSNLQFMYFLNSSDENTKKYFINKLGTKQVANHSYTSSKDNISENVSYQEKPLFTIKDLSQKPQDNILIFAEGLPPLYLKTNLTYKYFKSDNFKYLDNEESNSFKHFNFDEWSKLYYEKERAELRHQKYEKEIQNIMELENLDYNSAKERYNEVLAKRKNSSPEYMSDEKNIEIEQLLQYEKIPKIKFILKSQKMFNELEVVTKLYKEYQNSNSEFKSQKMQELKEYITKNILKT